MILSQTAEHALRAVLYVAGSEERGELIKVNEIADELRMPRNSLSKILHSLTRSGVLSSVRGPNGGFRLAIPAEQLSLARVVAPYDSVGQDRRCLLGRSRCTDDEACAAHDSWKSVSRQVGDFFHCTTVADLMRETSEMSLRAIL